MGRQEIRREVAASVALARALDAFVATSRVPTALFTERAFVHSEKWPLSRTFGTPLAEALRRARVTR